MPEATRLNLLAEDEPCPVSVEHADGRSPFFLTCDHAGRLIPRRLGTLGLPDSELDRHIAWDIGIAGVSRHLANALDATLICQIYSRLVIDCNRDWSVPSSICEVSELTTIPGNAGIGGEERHARQQEIFQPYHDRIAQMLDARAGRPTVLVAMHSFTPVFKGVARPWHVGVLYNRHTALPRILLDLLRGEGDLVVGDNEPYFISDLTDYTVPVHGERRGLPHVEIEIRQDLISDENGQRAWADRLARLFPEAYRRLQNTQARSDKQA
jgi:predicted N-formylglutamate amidohydrolase